MLFNPSLFTQWQVKLVADFSRISMGSSLTALLDSHSYSNINTEELCLFGQFNREMHIIVSGLFGKPGV